VTLANLLRCHVAPVLVKNQLRDLSLLVRHKGHLGGNNFKKNSASEVGKSSFFDCPLGSPINLPPSLVIVIMKFGISS
jgi:hypothetical protein